MSGVKLILIIFFSANELLIIGLDLVKNRVSILSIDMRKGYIGSVLVGLIEKTTDGKVMRAITRMVEDWVRTKVSEGKNTKARIPRCACVHESPAQDTLLSMTPEVSG